MPEMVNVFFAPDGLFALVKMTTVVAHCPGARLPKVFGNGAPFVVGEESVPVVSFTLFAVAPPVFCTVTPTAMSPQFERTSDVVVITIFGLLGVGVGVGVGVGLGEGFGVGDGDGDGLGEGDGDGVGVGVGVGVGPPGCNSNAPMSVPSPLFATAASSNVRANTWR